MKALIAAKILACLTLSYLCAVASIVVWRAGNAFDSNLAKWGDSGAQTFAGMNAALKTINTPKSGTLSMLDDTILQGRLTIDAANKVAIHEQLQLGTFDGYAEQGFADFERIANSGTRALNATTETAQAATRAIGTVDSTIAAGKPLLEAFTQDGKDLDSRINDPHVTALVAHLAGMSASGDKMLVDLNVWEHPFLNPEPCTTKKCQFGRYIWPVIKTGLGLGADANQVRLLTGHPLPVSVHP